ncbi:MAG: PH domain-containing protein [Bacillales bacterium]|jgi:membrane protein YdbS with pleckstrin-like domain|nr:PH domain-containing protein [Bacillales bacterium]
MIEIKNVSPKAPLVWFILRLMLLIVLIIPLPFLLIGIGEAVGDNLSARIVFSIILVILIIPQAIYTFVFPSLQYKKYQILIEGNKVTVKRGVIFLKTEVATFARIQHISTYRGILDRFFQMTNVFLITAGSNVRLTRLSLEQGQEVLSFVEEILLKNKNIEEAKND